jgi:aminoglycoside phosphotransferase (APT) family kinase protein
MDAVDAIVRQSGYRHLGGVSNRVYVDRANAEVLKLAVRKNAEECGEALQSFRACLAASCVYAPEGLMPEVLDVGSDFGGTGYPFLRERYVAGKNLAEEYLLRAEFWEERLPAALMEIYQRVLAGPSRNIIHSWDQNLTWHDELNSSEYFSRYAELHAAVKERGLLLRETAGEGFLIHGDLQFGNILALDGDRDGEVMLIDWQESGFWPLAFDFAMLYTFLMGPAEQVEDHLRPLYRSRPPLLGFWQALAPRLRSELGIGEELREFVIFRLGRGWLYKLDQALRSGKSEEAERWGRAVAELLEGRIFDMWPLP